MKNLACLLAGIILSIVILQGANHYVRQGASGNGSDWANAYGQLPATLVRGDTYYIADGNYPGYTFDDATQGTQKVITIKKATIANHGTNTGWNDSYGDGRAEFGSLEFDRSYYTIDGQVGGGPMQWTEGHGFYIHCTGKGILSRDGNVDNITIKHLEIEGAGPDGNASPDNDLMYLLGPINNWHLSHLYLHDSGRTHILANNTSGMTIEYCCLARNESMSTEHSEPIAWQKGDNNIIRYNCIISGAGTGAIVLKKNQDSWTNNNFKIYGNIVYGEPGHTAGFGNGSFCDTSGDVAPSSNIKVFNNTFVNLYGNAGINFRVGSGNEAYNNIWYNNNYVVSFMNTVHDYNFYYNNWRRDRNPPIAQDPNLVKDEPHSQLGTADPFTDWQNGNFMLKTATDAGKVLAAEYNTDMFGNTRGTDGVWDRGAIEFNKTNIECRTLNAECRIPVTQPHNSDIQVYNVNGIRLAKNTVQQTGIYLVVDKAGVVKKVTIIK